MNNKVDDKTNIDKVNEKLPIRQLIPLGLQHVLAMYAGAVIVPLIIGGSLGMNTKEISYLIAADLFTCGIATLIQSVGIGNFAGIKFPVILGCAFQAVGPMIIIGKASGIGAIYGSIIASGIFVLIASYFFGKILRFFPPVVIGSVITIIGLSLIPVAINNIAGGTGSETYGDPKNLALALFVMLFIVLINKFFRGFLKAISVLLGLIAGTLVASVMGMVNFNDVSTASWVNVVTPFYFGKPQFVLSGIFTMCLVSIVSMIESTGVFFATGKVVEKQVTEKDIVKGLRAEGLSQILGGVFNSFPYTTFSQNVGLIALTGIRSRYVVFCSGIILVILGTLPKFAALATVIPNPVLGGAMIIMFGMVAVSGIRTLATVDFEKTNNLIIAACAIGVGLGTAVVPELFEKMPQLFRILFESGIVSGSVTAIFLNIILNWNEINSKTSHEILLESEHLE